MDEEARDDLIDRIPDDMVIWEDEDELGSFPWTLRKWLDVLGHTRAHAGCCTACGCATTCMAAAFYGSTVSSVVRELDRIGALRQPTEPIELIEPTTEEWDTAISRELVRLGCTREELEAMAQSGDYASPAHRKLWLTIKPIPKDFP